MSGEDSTRWTEGSARKRKRDSPENVRAADLAKMVSTGTMTAVVEEVTHSGTAPSLHEDRLKIFNAEFEAMRQLVTCKICQRLLYEPYGLACGHTFCYSCLNQWIGPTKKKTCPDCRSVIRQQPTPSYLIRELVLIFINRRELLPEGETVEEHQQFAAEEAEIVNRDRASTNEENGGLFNGCFGKHGRLANYAIRDQSDNVDRCPRCFTEVEDGWCPSCDIRVRTDDDHYGTSDSEFSEELDQDLIDELEDRDLAEYDDGELHYGLDGHDDFDDSEDEEENDLHARELLRMHDGTFRRAFPIATRARPRPRRVADDSEEEEETDEEDPTMDGFVVDDNDLIDVESESESDATEVGHNAHQRQQQRRQFRGRVVLSDDDDETTLDPERVASVQEISSDGGDRDALELSEDSEDEGPIRASSQRDKNSRRNRTQRPVAVESDEDEDEDDDEDADENEADNGVQEIDSASSRMPTASFSPMSGGQNAADYGASEDEHDDNDDSIDEDEDGGEDEDDDEDVDEPDEDDERGVLHVNYGEEDDHDDEDDGEEGYDGSSDGNDWWEQYRIHPGPTSWEGFGHRLATLQRRRNRTLDAVANPRSRFPASPSLSQHRLRPPLSTSIVPPHPFQLDNTLHRIASRQRPPQSPRVHRHYRGISASSQGSAAGGVGVRAPHVVG